MDPFQQIGYLSKACLLKELVIGCLQPGSMFWVNNLLLKVAERPKLGVLQKSALTLTTVFEFLKGLQSLENH